MVTKLIPEPLIFSPNFIPLLEAKVSGVSVQDMLLCLPFLTPDTLNQICGKKTGSKS
jgi:hypothetical protein